VSLHPAMREAGLGETCCNRINQQRQLHIAHEKQPPPSDRGASISTLLSTALRRMADRVGRRMCNDQEAGRREHGVDLPAEQVDLRFALVDQTGHGSIHQANPQRSLLGRRQDL